MDQVASSRSVLIAPFISSGQSYHKSRSTIGRRSLEVGHEGMANTSSISQKRASQRRAGSFGELGPVVGRMMQGILDVFGGDQSSRLVQLVSQPVFYQEALLVGLGQPAGRIARLQTANAVWWG